MKLNYLMLGAACVMSLGASAADLSFSPGKQSWPPTGSYSEGSNNYLFDLSYSKSASQSIYSQNELSAIQPTLNADGSQDVASIKGVEVPFYMGMAYGLEGEATIKAYLTPYDGSSFPESGGKKMWIDYATENSVKGTCEITAYDDDVLNAAYGEDMVTVSIRFDEPYEYTGEGFVLTLVAESSLADGAGNDYWFMGTYNYSPGVSKCAAGLKGSSAMSGTIATTNLANVLPVVNFIYEKVHKEAQGGGETVGDPTTFSVGDYDGCAPSSTSAGMYLPYSAIEYDHSYSQIIYTPNELNGLAAVTATGTVKADITDVAFKLHCESDYLTGVMSGKVYVQKYAGTELPLVDGKPQWVAYDPAVYGTFESEEYGFSEFYDEAIELTAHLNTPLRYEEGESLLFTFVADCSTLEGMFGGELDHYVFKVAGKQSAVKAGFSELDRLSGMASNADYFVPVLKLGYTPVTVSGGAKPVLFENVEASLVKADLDPSIIGWGGATKANSIAVSFDLANAKADGKYDIIMGTSNCGTLTGTHGVLSFVAMPQGDVVLSVRPQEEGVKGGSTTIALADIDALFAAPMVEVAKDEDGKEMKAAYAEYTVWQTPGLNNTEPIRKTGVEIVAKFKFTTSAPVAVMKGVPANNQVKAVTGNSLPDCFADFVPTGDYSDYASNQGMISYYLSNENVLSASVSKGELVSPQAFGMAVNFSMDYPLVSKSTPMLGVEAVSAVASKTGFEKTAVSKKYDNGLSWGKESCTANFDFAAGDPEIIVDATYPSSFVMFDDKQTETLDFYAPDGHTIHYNWTPEPSEALRVKAYADEAEDVEWTAADGRVYSHPKSEPGVLMIKTKDADGNDSSRVEAYAISGEGTVTGIDSVTVGNEAAPAEFYDLTGRRVAKPSKGIFILRQGADVKKIAL